MGLLAIILLAVSLAIDCFTVSVTSGIILQRVRWNIFENGILLRTVSGHHAVPWLVGCQPVQPPHRRLRPLDSFRSSVLPGNPHDPRTFQEGGRTELQPDQTESHSGSGGGYKHRRLGRRNFVCLHRLQFARLFDASARSNRCCIFLAFHHRMPHRRILRPTLPLPGGDIRRNRAYRNRNKNIGRTSFHTIIAHESKKS